MSNGFSDKKFDRLVKAIDWSIMQFAFPRNERYRSIQQYVGGHYAEDGADAVVPVPMLKLAVDVFVRSLVARTPRVLISSIDPELRSTAVNLELAVNQIPDEIKLDATLRKFVTEALFSFGIVKVGLHSVGKVQGQDYDESFVDIVTLDDYFCDMSATHFDHIQFEGNDYKPVYEDLMDSGWLNKKERSVLDPPEDVSHISEQGEKRAEGISVNQNRVQFKKRIPLRDVWLPQEGLIVTYATESKKKVKVIEWDDLPYGPYHKLGFSDVPGNLLPLPVVSVWRDLHELGNELFRKLGRQAAAQKTVQGFSGGEDESVNNFKTAKDGDGIAFHASKPELLTAGGVSQTTLAFYLQIRDLYSYFAGNLDSLGGLAPMTETVGQDKLLSEAAGVQMRDMASKTTEIVTDIFRTLMWYEWNDPIRERVLQKPIPGMADTSIPVRWNSGSRLGNFDIYKLDIDVHSQIDDTPSLKLQRFGFIMQSYIIPLMPEIKSQGGQIDAQAILNLVAKLADFKELSDIISFVESAQQTGQQAGVQGSKGKPIDYSGEANQVGVPPTSAIDLLQETLSSGGFQDSIVQ